MFTSGRGSPEHQRKIIVVSPILIHMEIPLWQVKFQQYLAFDEG